MDEVPSDDDDLLAQIRANPHDDQLRLIYADALLARGDERGEYIAIAVAGGDDYGRMTVEQRARWLELEKRHPAWAAEFGCGELIVKWKRGLPYALTGNVETLIAHRDVLRRLPILSITLTMQARDLATLAELPELAFIEELTLPNDSKLKHEWGRSFFRDPLPRDELAALLDSPHLRKLSRLTFEDDALSGDTADALGAATAVLDQLEVLTFLGVTGTALEHASIERLPRLRELVLRESRLGENGGRAIGSWEMPVLERLLLDQSNLHGGARFLLGSPSLANVRQLRITRDQLVDDGAAALGMSAYPLALRELSFEQALIGTRAAVALANGNASPFPHLVKLELQKCDIEDPGASALAKSTRFPALQQLDLRSNKLTRDGAMALAAPTAIPTLTSLGISSNNYPTGETEQRMEIDMGIEVGMYTVPVQHGIAAVRSWFADRPALNVS